MGVPVFNFRDPLSDLLGNALQQGGQSLVNDFGDHLKRKRDAEALQMILQQATGEDGQIDVESLFAGASANPRLGLQAALSLRKQLVDEQLQNEKFNLLKEQSLAQSDKPTKADEALVADFDAEAGKALKTLELAEEAENLLETGSGLGGILPISGPILGQVSKIAPSPDQEQLEQLNFSLISNSFKTLPRIKSEFDQILKTGLSTTKSIEANKRFVNQIKRAANLVLEKSNRVGELEDQGATRSQALRQANKEFERIENEIAKEFRSISTPKKGTSKRTVTKEEALEILRQRGKIL